MKWVTASLVAMSWFTEWRLSSRTAPLVDSSPRHSSSAMLMLLSVVFLGLAVFLIYKFKRYPSVPVQFLHLLHEEQDHIPPHLLPYDPLLMTADERRPGQSIPFVFGSFVWQAATELVKPCSRIPMHEANAAISGKMPRERPLTGVIYGCCASAVICWINYSFPIWFSWKVVGNWKSCH